MRRYTGLFLLSVGIVSASLGLFHGFVGLTSGEHDRVFLAFSVLGGSAILLYAGYRVLRGAKPIEAPLVDGPYSSSDPAENMGSWHFRPAGLVLYLGLLAGLGILASLMAEWLESSALVYSVVGYWRSTVHFKILCYLVVVPLFAALLTIKRFRNLIWYDPQSPQRKERHKKS